MRIAPVQRRKIVAGLLVVASILSIMGFSFAENASAAASVSSYDSSWNPHVTCTAAVVRISDITNNQTASSTLPYGPYAPGITTSVSGGDAKRWLTQSSLDPSGWHGPGPPCTITNSVGQPIASFVEMDGVVVGDWSYEDCRSNYNAVNGGGTMPQTFCDSDGDLYDPAQVPNPSTACTSNTDPTCWGIIHVEFDGDWLAAGMCGPSTSYCNNNTLVSSTVRFSTSSLVDVQGFVYWDNEHTCVGTPSGCPDQWHSYNGWELHPLTAWRPHQPSTSPSVSFTYAPVSPNANTTISFMATAVGGIGPYSYSWTFGDGSTGTGASSAHKYLRSGNYTVTLTATDQTGNISVESRQISVSPSSTPPSQPPSGGVCLTCVVPAGLSTSLWLLVMAGLTMVVSLIALYTNKARAELAVAKERARSRQTRDVQTHGSTWGRDHALPVSKTQGRYEKAT